MPQHLNPRLARIALCSLLAGLAGWGVTGAAQAQTSEVNLGTARQSQTGGQGKGDLGTTTIPCFGEIFLT